MPVETEARLATICAQLFLFLTTFRRKARKTEFDSDWVRRTLIAIFKEQEATAHQNVDLARIYEKAKYPLVTLADEIVLDTDWPGAATWEAELLEQHFFGTSIAGEEFFKRLKEVRPEDEQLTEIYFLCLSLGFKGKFRNRPEERLELQQQLYARLPQRIAKKSDALCSGVYDYTVKKDMTKVPVVSFLRTAVILAGALMLALVAGRVLWNQNVSRLEKTMNEIAEWQPLSDGKTGSSTETPK